MAKGVAIKFKSYSETVPTLLELVKLSKELKKYDKIVIKPHLSAEEKRTTPKELAEQIAKFCLEHKNPVAEVFIAEGADGVDTGELFSRYSYKKLAETLGISLVDLNETETEEIILDGMMKFQSIHYPKILKDSFVISVAKLSEHDETEIAGSLSNMLGAFPANRYSGFFSVTKNKIRKWPIKYSIHDVLKIKMPNLALVDASEKGQILAGLPLEIDKRAAKLLGKDWRRVSHLALIDEAFPIAPPQKEQNEIQQI